MAISAETEKIDLMGVLTAQVADEVTQRVLDAYRPSALPPVEPYIGVDDAAQYMRCSDRRIYDLKAEGNLHFVKDGNRLLTKVSWIDEYLRAGSDHET